MSQNIQTQTTSDKPAEWPSVWNSFLDAYLTNNSGTSRPSKAEAGTSWLCTSNNTVYYYDGASDIALYTIDATNHLLLSPIGGGVSTLNSAATVDIGSVAHSAITVSGTTTITSFGTSMKPGQVKVLTFTGALTLTNSDSLILPGAANITTTAGDVSWILCTASGYYRCVCFQPVSGGMSATQVNNLITSALSSYATAAALTSEANTRASADSTLSTAISNEASTRASAISTLQSQMSNLSYVSKDQNYGNVGSFCFCIYFSADTFGEGTACAGSNLYPTGVFLSGGMGGNTYSKWYYSGNSLSGTWRCLGYVNACQGWSCTATLFQRIA
jgi:hypothetical protein